jgi:hypothetical protein
MKKFLMLLAVVAMFAAPALSFAQTLTDYEYNRLTLGNNFANEKAKPILRIADRALHAPVSTLALLSAIEYGARYQGMVANVDTGLYFYDATDCGIGATSPTAVAPDDTVGCWYLMSASADVWAALIDTTPTSGAMLIGIKDTANYYTGVTVETALAEVGAEFLTKQDLAVPAAAGNIATLSALGQVQDSTHDLGDYQVLAVPGAVGNVATLDATGQVIDSTFGPSVIMFLAMAPTNGNFLCTDALGQGFDCGSAPADYTLDSDLLATGNSVPLINTAITGVMFPAAPADGFRLFCTATGGGYDEGKVYTYAAGTGYDAGVALLAGQMVQTRDGNFVLGGATLADWVQLSDYAVATHFESRITQIVDIISDTIPADPGIEGYRVFMTSTDGALAEGFVYVWDDTGNVWDAGTRLADGQIVASKGSAPDVVVGGTLATNYVQMSQKLDADKLACKDLTVALGADTGAAAADTDWVSAYYLSASPVSGADQVVESVTIAGDGAIALTLAAVSTAEAVYRVCAILD